MTDTYGVRSDVATVLVQHMLDVAYGGSGDSSNNSRKLFVLSFQKQELVNAIVDGAADGEDSGTIDFPVLELDFDNNEKSNVVGNDSRSFRFATAKATDDLGDGIAANDQNTNIKPPTVHWMWQKKQNPNGDGEIEERLCLSLLAPSGGELLLLADTTTTEPETESPSSTSSSLAVRVSNFQWTIEASVPPPLSSSSSSSSSSGQIELSTFWKFKTIEFWKKLKKNHGGAGGEGGRMLLVQFQDVTLMGTLLLHRHQTNLSSYQFMPRSILQMKIGHNDRSQADDNPSSMLEDDLFSLWSTLDGIQGTIQFPNLMMTMTPSSSSSSTSSSAVPFESTDQTSLGDIFQHYLANHLPSSSSQQPSPSEPLQAAGSTSMSESSSLPPTWNVTSSLPTGYTRPSGDINADSETPETDSAEVDGAAASSSSSQLRQRLNERISSVRSSISSVNINVSDSVVATSALMASGTSFVTPIGAAVSVAALAAKDTVVAVAEKGKQTRLSQQPSSSSSDNKGEDEGEELLFDNVADATVFERSVNDAGLESGGGARSISSNTSQSSSRSQNDSIVDENSKYKFGDLTRGVVASIREKRQQQQGDGDTDQNVGSSTTTAEYLKANEGKFVGVMGASAGAGVGLLVAGPIGAVAGSVAGSLSSQAALRRQREQQFHQESNRSFGGEEGSQVEAPATASSLFRIGDNFRSLVAKGKEASARVVSSAQPSSSTSIEQLNGENTTAETTPTTTSVLKSKASLFGANLRGAVAKGKAAAEGVVEKGKAAAEGVVVEGKTSTGRDADSTYRFGDFSRGLIKSYKNRGTTTDATVNPPSVAAPPSSSVGDSQPETTRTSTSTQAPEGYGDVTEQNNYHPVTRSV